MHLKMRLWNDAVGFMLVFLALSGLCRESPVSFPAKTLDVYSANVKASSSLYSHDISMTVYCNQSLGIYREDSVDAMKRRVFSIMDFNNATRIVGVLDENGNVTSCSKCSVDDVIPLVMPQRALFIRRETIDSIICEVYVLLSSKNDYVFYVNDSRILYFHRTIKNKGEEYKIHYAFDDINPVFDYSVFSPPFNPGVECVETVCKAPIDIVLAIDCSSHASSSDFDLIKGYLLNMIKHFSLSDKTVRFGFVQFADTVREFIYFVNDITEAMQVVDLMNQLDSANESGMEDALVGSAFMIANMGRRSCERAIFLITYQNIPNYTTMKKTSETIKNDGVYIYIVGIGDEVNQTQMKSIASLDENPLQPHYLHASSFGELMTDSFIDRTAAAGCKSDSCSPYHYQP